MLIQEMSRQESLDLLARAHLGRLGCAHKSQPYVVPFYFAYDKEYLYSFSTLGQKIEWMRANPKVCVEADEVVSPQQWRSVIAFGSYEELPDFFEGRDAREYARDQLARHNVTWWEPGLATTILNGKERPLTAFFYRIHIEQISGHRATPEKRRGARPSRTGATIPEWLQKLLRPVRKQT